MGKTASLRPTSESILSGIREAEMVSRERIEKASIEAAVIVDNARAGSEKESEIQKEQIRSEIAALNAQKEERLRVIMEKIHQEREEANERLRERANSNFPRAISIVLEIMTRSLND